MSHIQLDRIFTFLSSMEDQKVDRSKKFFNENIALISGEISKKSFMKLTNFYGSYADFSDLVLILGSKMDPMGYSGPLWADFEKNQDSSIDPWGCWIS